LFAVIGYYALHGPWSIFGWRQHQLPT
jgi:hypothetical protein